MSSGKNRSLFDSGHLMLVTMVPLESFRIMLSMHFCYCFYLAPNDTENNYILIVVLPVLVCYCIVYIFCNEYLNVNVYKKSDKAYFSLLYFLNTFC